MARSRKSGSRKPRDSGSRQGRTLRKSRPAGGSRNLAENGVRLQKVLAAAGIGSRRQCEAMILEGRVEVDGETVTELGTRVDAQSQKIRVDGEALRRPKTQYFLVNKPVGLLSTNRDPSGRPRVIDLAPSHQRLFTVGRLDKSSEGLILVTNDGELTDLLTHPRYGVEKTYLAVVAGVPTQETIAKLRRGVQLAEGYAHAKRLFVRKAQKHSAVLEIVLDEGRNREVRRLLARVGHKVMKLRRTAIGPLRLADLKPGESRPLRREEVEQLYAAAREGRRRKAEERRDRSLAKSESADVPATQSDARVHPIIDRSLPFDSPSAAGEPDLLGAAPAGSAFADDELIGEVDLRPFKKTDKPGKRATIIGADEVRTPRRRKRRFKK